jgi:hypothetical protein
MRIFTRHPGIAAIVLVTLARFASAGDGPQCVVYDAALETLPDAQGWTKVVFKPRSVTASIVDGALHQSSLPFADATCPGPPVEEQYLYWQSTESFNHADGVAFEAEVRIFASEHGVNPCNGWTRPGFAISLQDDLGRVFWVGIGETEVFLANGAFLTFGSPGVVEADFNTTDGFHVYRLEVLGSNATLFIDGTPTVAVAGFGDPAGVGALAYIGDGTGWCNSEAAIRRFALDAGGGCCPADLNGDGVVDGADLGLLLAAWSTDGAGDLNDDDTVDGADLGLLLAAWGDC